MKPDRHGSTNESNRRDSYNALFMSALVVGAVLAGALAFAGAGLAASNATVTQADDPIDPDQADEGRAVSNVKVNFTVNNIAGDGDTDFVYLQFPNELANTSGFGYNSFTKNSSPGVSGSLVDGPDSDGLKDTVTLSGWDSGSTYNSSVSVDMTFDTPNVTADTTYDVTAKVKDSQAGSATPNITVAQFTVLNVDGPSLSNASATVDEGAGEVTLSYDVSGSSEVGTFYKIYPAASPPVTSQPEYGADPGFFSGPTESGLPGTVTRTVPLSGSVDPGTNDASLQEGERYVFEAYVNGPDGFATTLSRFVTPSGPLAVELSGSAANGTAVTLTANVTGFNGTDTVGSFYAYGEQGSSGSATFTGGPNWDVPDQDKTTTITGLSPGTTYAFTITVSNGDGDRVQETVTVTTPSS